MAVMAAELLKTCRQANHEILIDVLIFTNFAIYLYLFISLCMLQSGKSALQVWGISSNYWQDQDAEMEDEDKEAFKAHVEALFTDVL